MSTLYANFYIELSQSSKLNSLLMQKLYLAEIILIRQALHRLQTWDWTPGTGDCWRNHLGVISLTVLTSADLVSAGHWEYDWRHWHHCRGTRVTALTRPPPRGARCWEWCWAPHPGRSWPVQPQHVSRYFSRLWSISPLCVSRYSRQAWPCRQ